MATNDILIRDPTPEDIRELADEMREADALELERHTGLDPLEGVVRCVAASYLSRVAIVNGEVAAAWGVVCWSVSTGQGSPWCFTTSVVEENKRAFLRLSKFYLEELRNICPVLLGVHVDAEYKGACLWLEWLGFTLEPVEVNGYPFCWATLQEAGDGIRSSRRRDSGQNGSGDEGLLRGDVGGSRCPGVHPVSSRSDHP